MQKAGKTFSESWHRVAGLKVSLRPTVRVRKQLFRGETWYVLHDPFNNQFFRLRPEAHDFVIRLGPDRTVEEIWYFLSGRGEMWRKLGDQEEMVPVDPGVCITIPVGTHFQWRSFGYEPLSALGITMPPWPGEGEAHFVEGKWEPTVESGPA